MGPALVQHKPARVDFVRRPVHRSVPANRAPPPRSDAIRRSDDDSSRDDFDDPDKLVLGDAWD